MAILKFLNGFLSAVYSIAGVYAIELTGHFRSAEYSLDNGLHWIEMETSKLSLQLDNGNHSIWFRAIDLHGNRSTNILQQEINIDVPVYRKIWFWFCIWSKPEPNFFLMPFNI